MATVDVMPYLPFMDGSPDGAFRWRLGVRPLDLANWIEWGPDADQALADKARLNAEHPETVFAVLDDIEPEAAEIASELRTHVGAERAAAFDESLHPLDAAARLVPEDLVLMVERDGSGERGDGERRLVFGGGSVCFPNRWDLRSKLGCTMAEVHAPVAKLNEQLEVPVDRFFERLTPQRSYWRLGWGILDTADWYTPLDGTAADRPVDPGPADMFLRVERETLRRFPVTDCVLFTIRTYVTPLSNIAADPVVASRLAASLDGMPDDVRDYKDLAETANCLARHLGASEAE